MYREYIVEVMLRLFIYDGGLTMMVYHHCARTMRTNSIVDVTLSILLAMYEVLHLLLRHLLAQSHQQVVQLSSRNTTIALLVKMSQSFDKIIDCVGILLARYCL